MPSLRKRVSTYLRQLSFHNEPRSSSSTSSNYRNLNENSFVTKYLQGQIKLREGPPIIYGKTPNELPNYELDQYQYGSNTIIGCYTGPKGGLTTIKRVEKHLSIPDQDIDFIDNGTILDDNDDNPNINNDNQQHNDNNDENTITTTTNQINIDDSLLPNDWLKKSDFIYGISDSLYDRNQITNNRNGDPIADCFGIITRDDSAILAVADGVNWGEKASIAAKSAIHGCLHYLNRTIFNDTKPFDKLTIKHDDLSNPNDDVSSNDSNYNDKTFQCITNTKEIFICLLRAFNCAHDLILENNGMLTTLTVAIILPLKRKIKQQDNPATTTKTLQNNNNNNNIKQYICCVCNVGDTLAYIYSKKSGIRELTKGSHDINCLRDMRDALGALGPVDGINPELSNLTLSLTTLQHGDIVMVCSDGLTDNFDPNVCRFTVNQLNDNKENHNNHKRDSIKQHSTKITTTTTTTRQQQSSRKAPVKPPRRSQPQQQQSKPTTTTTSQKITDNESNPLIEHFLKENPIDKKPNDTRYRRQISSPSCTETTSSSNNNNNKPPPQQGYKFLRSKTTIDVKKNNHRHTSTTTTTIIQRNEDGIPYVTPIQRYELQLLLMEDIIMNGINEQSKSATTRTTTAKQLCENLINFTYSITSAKRHTLEDNDLYYNNCDGLLVELSQQEKRQRRKRCLDKIQNLPGKLDHVSIVAWNVGNTV